MSNSLWPHNPRGASIQNRANLAFHQFASLLNFEQLATESLAAKLPPMVILTPQFREPVWRFYNLLMSCVPLMLSGTGVPATEWAWNPAWGTSSWTKSEVHILLPISPHSGRWERHFRSYSFNQSQFPMVFKESGYLPSHRALLLGKLLQGSPRGRFRMSIFENTIASFLRDPASTPIKELCGCQLTPPDYLARWLDQSLCLLNVPFGTVGMIS